MNLIIFSILIAVCHAQKLIDLKSLQGNNHINSISDTTTAIYASASIGNKDYLKSIILTTGSKNISVYDLTQRKVSPGSDQLDPWTAQGTTTLTTSLTTQQLKTLVGFIYCTTEKQSADPFRVISVDQVQNLWIDSTTTVFLNSRFLSVIDVESTKFSSWSQKDGASVKFYQNLPSDDEEANNTQIFSNPVLIGDNYTFIPTVNDFAVTLRAFYIKYNGEGHFSVQTEPASLDINRSKTKSVTSTGLYTKSYVQVRETIQVNLMNDRNYHETSGVNFIGDFPLDGNVTVSLEDNVSKLSFVFKQSNQIQPWTTSSVARKLTIATGKADEAQVFVQYFTIQGRPLNESVTTPTSATSTGKPTTDSPVTTPTPAVPIKSSTTNIPVTIPTSSTSTGKPTTNIPVTTPTSANPLGSSTTNTDPVTDPTSATTIEASTKSTGKLNIVISTIISVVMAVVITNY